MYAWLFPCVDVMVYPFDAVCLYTYWTKIYTPTARPIDVVQKFVHSSSLKSVHKDLANFTYTEEKTAMFKYISVYELRVEKAGSEFSWTNNEIPQL